MALTAAVRAQAIGQVTVDTQSGSSTVTLAATADTRHVIRSIIFGYSANTETEVLTIVLTVGGSSVTITVPVQIAALQPTQLSFERGELVGDDNTAVTITLAEGSGTSYLNVIHE